MRVEKQTLLSYIEGNNKRFVIPPYQRNYDWKSKNWERLCSDISKVILTGKTHFFGSFVSYKQINAKTTDYVIIDGQQRLVTASLVLVALRALLRQNLLESKTDDLENIIYEKYLVNDPNADDSIKYRLKPFRGDMDAYRSIYQDDNTNEKPNIVQAYNFIKSRMEMLNKDAQEILDAFEKFEVVDIECEDGIDDPQEIFETINSTGLPLSESDKIRNYIFMGLSATEQEMLYDGQWLLIERNTKYRIDTFISDYIESQIYERVSTKDLYSKFQSFIKPEKEKYISNGYTLNEAMKKILSNIANYSYNWSIFEGDKQWTRGLKANEINAALKRLKILKATSLYPFLLTLFNKLGNKEISEDDLIEILNTVETYIIRMKVIGMGVDKKIFTSSFTVVDFYDGDNNNYAEKFKAYLCKITGRNAIPHDYAFSKSLCERTMLDKDLIFYLLTRIEDPSDIDMHLWDNVKKYYTLEHIMPQTLTKEWELEIKKGVRSAEECYNLWLNRLANLTITNHNSAYSNKPFQEKCTMTNGYASSSIQLNHEIAKYSNWTAKEMEDRATKLAEKCLKIWPMIFSKYKIPVAAISEVDIGTKMIMAHKKINGYTFQGKFYPRTQWKDAYMEIIDRLYKMNSQIMLSCIDSKEKVLAGRLKSSGSRNNKINDDLYLGKDANTDTKLQILRALFDKYNLPYNALIFTLDTSANTLSD